MRASLDRGGPPVRAEYEELLAVLRGVVRFDVERPGRRLEVRRQPGVRVDRVGVRFDDVHGPSVRVAAGGTSLGRRPPEHVDLLRGVVEDQARPDARQRAPTADPDRTVVGAVATDRHDLVAGVVGAAGGHVQLRVLDAGDVRDPVRPARHLDLARHAAGGRIDERDPLAGGHGDSGQVDDLDPGQPAVGDRLLDVRPRLFVAARAPQEHRRVRAGIREARLVVGGIGLEDLGQHRRDGGRVVDGLRRGDEGRPGPRGGQVGDGR